MCLKNRTFFVHQYNFFIWKSEGVFTLVISEKEKEVYILMENKLKNSFQEREILNIQETLARAERNGFPISEYTLRRALRSGAIPCRIVGRTYLIAWSNFVKWLMCEDSSDNPVCSQDCPGEFAHLH